MSKVEPIFGVDISGWQRGIDLGRVKSEGYEFCIVKATEGPYPDGTSFTNSAYAEQIRQADEAGLVVGAYHFLVETPARAQVDHFLEVVGDVAGKILAVDYEAYPTPGHSHLDPTMRTLEAFVEELRRRVGDHPIVVYAGQNYWDSPPANGPITHLNVTTWDAWYQHMRPGFGSALYEEARVVGMGWGKRWGDQEPMFWQFSQAGKVAGLQIDVDAFRGTREQLLALTGGEGVARDPGGPTPPTGEAKDKVPNGRRTPAQLAEEAIALGTRLLGTPYGDGWKSGTWPDGPSLYARCDPRVHTVSFARNHEMICSAFVNFLRAHVAALPAVGRAQGDGWPGGTAAFWRTFGRMRGVKPYPPVENTPRGWLVYSPYLGPSLPMQGHVGIALGDGKVLEARVPALSNNRTEDEGHRALIAGGGQGYTTIIPPSIWLKV